MAYLLDTNHCVYLLNGLAKPSHRRSTAEASTIQVASITPEPLYMSEVTLGELYYEAAYSSQKKNNLERIAKLIQTIKPQPLQQPDWLLFAELKADLRRQGKSMSDFDLLIAASALTRQLVLVTADADFSLLSHTIQSIDWSQSE